MTGHAPTPVRCLVASLLVWVTLPAAAQFVDPLKSQACAEALQALQEARGNANREALRSQAARACLGATGAPPAGPARVTRPPEVVPPPLIEPLADPPSGLPAAPRPAPPPVAVDRAPVITGCDAHGCWTADGGRLPRAGPGLGGPCMSVGGFAYCP